MCAQPEVFGYTSEHEKSLLVCLIFNKLFQRSHSNHFGAPPTTSQLYIYAGTKVVKQTGKSV